MRVRLISLLALMVFSCESYDSWWGERRIVNETQHILRIEVFSNGNTFGYDVESHGELILEGGCLVDRAFKECKLGWPGGTDSAHVTFGQERVLTYTQPNYGDCNNRNIAADPIFECHGYEAMEIGGDTIQYTYRITEADYQSAQPITE